MNVTYVGYMFFHSSLRCRSRCWVPHTCLCSCIPGRTHLQHTGWHCHFRHKLHAHRQSAGWWLTPLTPFPCVAFGAGAHVVPHALASILTGGAAHSCKRQDFLNLVVLIFFCNKDSNESNLSPQDKTFVKRGKNAKAKWTQLGGVTANLREIHNWPLSRI